MRDTWLAIDLPDAETRALYPLNGTPLSATTSSDDNYASRLVFWLKTDDGQSAREEIRRSYLKVTTGESDSSPLAIQLVQLTIQKGQKTSELISLQPAPGTTERLLQVEFKARNIFSEGFDPPLNGDKDRAGNKDEDNWVAYTSVCRNAPLNVNTKTKVVFGAGVDLSAFEIAPAADSTQLISVTPSSPTANETNLTITALGGGDTIANATVVIRKKSDHSGVLSMKVLLLPERQTVRCRFFRLLDSTDTTGFGDDNPDDGDPQRRWRLLSTSIPSPGAATAEIDSRFSQAAVFASPTAPELPTGTNPEGFGLREFNYEEINPNGKLDREEEFDRINAQRGLFTSQGKDGADCIVVYVPWLVGLEAMWNDKTDFVFVGVNAWVQNPGWDAPEDAVGGTEQMARVLAHEFGHWLDLSSRGIGIDFHDDDPHPEGTVPLMRDGAVFKNHVPTNQNFGRWIRHEDWEAANKRAKARGL